MLCPHCDEIIDSGASICPVCGKHTGAGKSSPPKKKSSKIIAVVVLAAAVALMAVIMITGGLGMAPDMGTDSDKNVYRASYGVGTVPTTVDMVSGYGIDVTFLPGTGGGEDIFRFELNNRHAYGFFQWTVRDMDHSAYDTYTRDTATGDFTRLVTKHNDQLTYKFVKYEGRVIASGTMSVASVAAAPGRYAVSVDCYKSESDFNNRTKSWTYDAEFVCNGVLVKDYKWKYSLDPSKKKTEKSFELKFSYFYDDYADYRDSKSNPRRPVVGNESLFVKYAVVDDRIAGLSDTLSMIYKLAYGENAPLDGQNYADFLLAFVQINYAYPPNNASQNGDTVLYGAVDYYAYPLETVHRGTGDCEDTSILLASLYKSSGFKTALGIVPGHAIAGVAVRGTFTYIMSDSDAAKSGITAEYGNMQPGNGLTYYACETTPSNHMPLGYLMKNDIADLKDVHRFYPVP